MCVIVINSNPPQKKRYTGSRANMKMMEDEDGYLTEEKRNAFFFSVSSFFWARDDRLLDKEPLCRALSCSLLFLTTVFRVLHFLLYFKLDVHLLPLKPLHLKHLLSSPPSILQPFQLPHFPIAGLLLFTDLVLDRPVRCFSSSASLSSW